jgi:hypothetical protein
MAGRAMADKATAADRVMLAKLTVVGRVTVAKVTVAKVTVAKVTVALAMGDRATGAATAVAPCPRVRRAVLVKGERVAIEMIARTRYSSRIFPATAERTS